VHLDTIIPLFDPLGNLRHLALGRGHLLSPRALQHILSRLPLLEHLDLFYDNFFVHDNSHPVRTSKLTGHLYMLIVNIRQLVDALVPQNLLPNLQTLTILHQGVGDQQQFAMLFAFISDLLRETRDTRRLSSFRLGSDDRWSCTWSSTTQILFEELSHHNGLRVLDVCGAVCLARQLFELSLKLPTLERVAFAVKDVPTLVSTLYIHGIDRNVITCMQAKIFSVEGITRLGPALQRICWRVMKDDPAMGRRLVSQFQGSSKATSWKVTTVDNWPAPRGKVVCLVARSACSQSYGTF
jgi:hypothetical protein